MWFQSCLIFLSYKNNKKCLPISALTLKESQLIKKLKKHAMTSMKNAYSPYSDIKVGAAVLDEHLRVYSGCNIENASYGLTICAERVAAAKAISSGSKYFLYVLVVSDLEGFVYPCGACRQFLMEFSSKDEDMKVVVASNKGDTRVLKLSSLLPNAFELRRVD